MLAGSHPPTMAWAWSLLGFALPLSPDLRFTEQVVARVEVGAAADQISNRECAGAQEFCSAGFAFGGAGDTVWFYDAGHGNLKVVAGSGAVGVVPGPAGLRERERPIDGTVGADGLVYLRTSMESKGAPQRTWRYARDGRWELSAGPSRWAPPRGTAADVARGVLLGVDRRGNRYYEARRSWSTTILVMYDAAGRRIAATNFPERPVWKPVSHREKWVAADGAVYEVHVSERWLVISRWIPEG